MRILSLLLYVLTLIPITEACDSEDCGVRTVQVHSSLHVITGTDCCHDHDTECEIGDHHHSLDDCNENLFSLVRTENAPLQRTVSQLPHNFSDFIASTGVLRGPPTGYFEYLSNHTPLQIKVISSTVFRC